MKHSVLVMVILFCTALPALAGGLHEGAKVRFVQKGETFTGILTSVRSGREPLLIINPYGGMVRIPMREIRRIRATGKKRLLTLPWIFPLEQNFDLYEFNTLDGSWIVAAVDPEPVFIIRIGADGVEREFELEELELIEAQ